MIKTTLNRIRAHNPCKSGWKTLLKNKGKAQADDEDFPLSDIVESNGLTDALWCLRCHPEHDNLWRLYAVWCAEQVKHLMTDARSISALEVAKRHAQGRATDGELDAAGDAAWDAAWAAGAAARDARAAARAAAWDAAWDAAGDAAWDAARDAAWDAARAAAWDARDAGDARAAARAAAWDARDAARAAAWDAARAAQKEKLLEILTAGVWPAEAI